MSDGDVWEWGGAALGGPQAGLLALYPWWPAWGVARVLWAFNKHLMNQETEQITLPPLSSAVFSW